ncbi:MAG TPA: sigma 54-interacting transcriptional regulator [Terriglobales bacterium]|jgi:formate hydrogenlyase transcriptional activator|nr:sigma 54-interacting transcriptional regulator [Terriglobales bacterium]
MSGNRLALDEYFSPEHNRYRLLLEITDVVAQSRSLSDAFKELAPAVLALTGGELLNLSLYDPRRDCILTQYWKKNQESGKFGALPVDDAASGWAWKHQKLVAIPDTEREQRFSGCVPVLLNHGVRSYTVLPMSTPSRHFGALGLGKRIPEVLDQEDIEFLSRVALMGALALEKERAQRAYEEQQSLVAISHKLSSSLELDDLLPAILSSLRNIARYDRAILCLLQEDGRKTQLYGEALEWEPFVNHEDSVPLERSLSAQAIETRAVVFLNDSDLRNMDLPLIKVMYESGVRSVCSVPLIAGNRIWGALNLSSMTDNVFGASDVEYLEQVANQIAIALQNSHAYREIAQLKERLAQEKRYLEYEIRSANRSDDIVGTSAALKRVLDYAAIVADTDSTVLITGETGTGKERIARVIHSMSRRKERNFIKLNCAAIPTGLLESELFGHEKGAFTGAVSQKLGRLELADKGTLLLDEIGEIPLELQPKLLRVLQDQEFERLGGNKTIRVDVRVIAATNRDLIRAVEEKEFRGDLFYRLHVFPLHLPALRDRREDIPMLIRHFVEKCSARLHKRIDIVPDEAIEAMKRWSWPGNIRELENFIERSVILSEGNRLTPPLGELREEISRQQSDADGTLRDKEREHIIEILRQTRGALSGPSGAATRLGLKRTTLQYKMQRLGISRTDYLS